MNEPYSPWKKEKEDKEAFEDMKKFYRLQHDRKFIEENPDSFIYLPTAIEQTWAKLSKDQKYEFSEWKKFERRIRENDFPELAQ